MFRLRARIFDEVEKYLHDFVAKKLSLQDHELKLIYFLNRNQLQFTTITIDVILNDITLLKI